MAQERKKKGKLLWILLAVLVILAGGVATALVMFLGDFTDNSQGYTGGLYWNVDRAAYAQGSATGMSSRKADADGVFQVRFLHEGKLKDVQIADKRLINKIDTKDAMGLILDENGVAVDVVDVKKVAKEIAMKSFVKTVAGNVIQANASIAFNGMNHKLEVTDTVGIYDVDPESATLGKALAPTDLQFTDALMAYGNLDGTLTHIFLVSHAKDTPVYWRYDQQGSNGETTRQADADGVYTIPFAAEGKLVELKTKNKKLVDEIDTSKGYLSPHYAFGFDKDGYISEIVTTQAGLFGIMACERLEVHQLEGRTFTAEGMYESDQGKTYSATLPDNCPIYDVSEAAFREGRFGQEVDGLKMHDRISVWTDVDGAPKFVFIQNRLVGAGYFIYPGTQRDKDTNETMRKTNSKGWYEIQLIKNGTVGVKTYKTKDRELVNYLDRQGSSQVVGLKLDGDIILQVYNSESVYGYAPYWRGATITNILGNLVTVSRGGTDSGTIVLADNFKAYDMSGANELGTEVELQVGDVIEPHRDLSAKIQVAYVTRRTLGEKVLYFNVGGAKYDSKKEVTTRTKDEKGYYVFEMFNYKGQKVTLKTKDKKIATQVDSQGSLCMSLVVKNGIIKRVLDASYAYGKFITSYMMVDKLKSDGTMELVAVDSEYKITFKADSKMKVYNFSNFYDKQRGEKVSKLKVGDVIACFADNNNNVMMCWIRDKMMPELLWVAKRTTFETPVPDAKGYYTIQALKNGKLVEYKTKDIAHVNDVNTRSGAFSLYVKNGEVKAVSNDYHVQGLYPQVGYGWDVTSISGKKVTVQYKYPGEEQTGEKVKLTLSSKVKIYDVSPTAKNYGATTTLKKGDVIVAYKDPADGKTTYIFVKFRANRADGVDGYCVHCGTEVHWRPWNGGGGMGAGHYYLNNDGAYFASQASVGATNSDYEAVLDLNGKKLNVYGNRAFLVQQNETLTIIDSVGGGEIAATGNSGGANGGVGMISGGTVNLFSGTLRLLEAEGCAPSKGGVFAIYNGTFNMYGGKVIGGQIAQDGQGGSLYVSNSKVTVAGGTISGGAAAYGGNVRVADASKFILCGGTVTGGKVSGQGGNFSLVGVDSTLTVNNSAITGGTAAMQGGNIYCNNDTVVEITNGTVTGGTTAESNGGNLALDGAKLTVKDSTISNGQARLGGNIYLFGGATATLTSGTISGGTALDGGNVRLEGGSQFTLSDGKITGGTATSQGGNFSLKNDGTVLNIAGGEITGGTSTNQGGNIYANPGSVVNLSSGTIKDGTSTAQGGGNLTLEAATLTMTDGVITNGAATMGGNIYLMSGATADISGGKVTDGTAAYGGNVRIADASKFNLVNSAVSGGTATGQGGNFSLVGIDTTLNITDSEITGGNATQQGGNIYCNNDTIVEITNSTVTGGTTAESNGGNLALDGAKLTMTESTVSDGQARLGGNIYLFGGAVANVSGGAITGGTAVDGGNVRMEGGSKFTISGGKVTGGTASSQGGNFSVKSGCAVNVSSGEITGGTSKNQGGNIYAEEAAITMSGGKVSGGKSADSYGGNLAMYAAQLNMTDGTISDGEAYVGGNIFQSGGESKVSGGAITGGTAADGGAVRLQGGAKFTLSGGKVTGGTASKQGGNFCLKEAGTVLTISGGEVTGGTSTNQGGNIYCNPNTVVSISGGKVTGGSTTGNNGGNLALENATLNLSDLGEITGGNARLGGNIYLFGGAVANVSGGTISGGTALDGGNVRMEGGSQFTLSGGSITGGTATGQGGNFSLKNDGTTLNVSGGEISGGTSTNQGGNIYCNSGTIVNISGGSITGGKTSGNSGGNLALEKAKLTMTDGTVSNGEARLGGNIFLFSGATADVSGGTISGGTALDGGSVRMEGGSKFNLSGGKVTGGTATSQGGNFCLKNDGTTLTIVDGSVTGGTSKNQGGNIYCNPGTVVNFSGGSITGGTSTASGGGNLALEKATLNMTGGTISGGSATNDANLYAFGGAVTNINGGIIE